VYVYVFLYLIHFLAQIKREIIENDALIKESICYYH
jgi:hypothetical protein